MGGFAGDDMDGVFHRVGAYHMAAAGDGLQFLQYLQGSGNLVGDPNERHIGAPHVNLAIQLVF